MTLLRRKLPTVMTAAALAAAFMTIGPVTAGAATNATCAGGSVPGGAYDSLTITGFCPIDSGLVEVRHNLTIAPGGALNAAFFGSNLKIGHDLLVGSSGILVLGCEPFAFPCFNDPNAMNGGTEGMQTNDSIGHNLTSNQATMVLLHHSSIKHNVVQSGGGDGVTCASQPLGPNGPPAYSTYEDNTVGGNVSVVELGTCWAGFFRNTVWGNVTWNKNITADEDGNEIATNTIHGSLSCFDNDPAVQFGDSQGIPNIVFGEIRGQCTAVSTGPPPKA